MKRATLFKFIGIGILALVAVVVIGYFVGYLWEALGVLFGGGGLAAAKAMTSKRKEQEAEDKADDEYDGEVEQIERGSKKQTMTIQAHRLQELKENQSADADKARDSILKNVNGYVVLAMMFVFILIASLLFIFFPSIASANAKVAEKRTVCFTLSESKQINARVINLKYDLAQSQVDLRTAKKKHKAKVKNIRKKAAIKIDGLNARLIASERRVLLLKFLVATVIIGGIAGGYAAYKQGQKKGGA